MDLGNIALSVGQIQKDKFHIFCLICNFYLHILSCEYMAPNNHRNQEEETLHVVGGRCCMGLRRYR